MRDSGQIILGDLNNGAERACKSCVEKMNTMVRVQDSEVTPNKLAWYAPCDSYRDAAIKLIELQTNHCKLTNNIINSLPS